MNPLKITKDVANKRLVVERLFKAAHPRVWKAWTTAEQLVKWWGPKEWPASSKSLDFRAGGHWHYWMTGPDGTQAWGWIDYTAVQAMDFFHAQDSFCDAEGNKNNQLPSTEWLVTFKSIDRDSTKVTAELRFATETDLNQLVEMGFEAGFSEALNNLEEFLGTGR